MTTILITLDPAVMDPLLAELRQPRLLTLADLEARQQLLDNEGPAAFYAKMLEDRYFYAGWAKGVVENNTIAGRAANDFLNSTANTTLGCQPSPTLTETIKRDMAQAYLDTLRAIAKESGGQVSRDINAREVWDFHRQIFENHDLSINNWTLQVPFTLRFREEGEKGLERFWQDMRDTAGSDFKATIPNTMTWSYVQDRSASENPEIRQMAEFWLKHTPGFNSLNGLSRSMDALVGRDNFDALFGRDDGDKRFCAMPLSDYVNKQGRLEIPGLPPLGTGYRPEGFVPERMRDTFWVDQQKYSRIHYARMGDDLLIQGLNADKSQHSYLVRDFDFAKAHTQEGELGIALVDGPKPAQDKQQIQRMQNENSEAKARAMAESLTRLVRGEVGSGRQHNAERGAEAKLKRPEVTHPEQPASPQSPVVAPATVNESAPEAASYDMNP